MHLRSPVKRAGRAGLANRTFRSGRLETRKIQGQRRFLIDWAKTAHRAFEMDGNVGELIGPFSDNAADILTRLFTQGHDSFFGELDGNLEHPRLVCPVFGSRSV